MEEEGGGVICHFDKFFTRNVPHILEKIFFLLDYGSFETSSMVNIAWNELLTSKRFQKLGKLKFRVEK